MFKLSEIKELIKLVDQSSLQEVEIKENDFELKIRKPDKNESVIVQQVPQLIANQPVMTQPQEAASAAMPAKTSEAAPVEDTTLHKITSPMVGTFYQAPSPDADPFVKPGGRVTEKTVVCIVEAMKLMNEIEAEVKGEIVEVLVDNGQLVEFGQPLFLVRREDKLK